MVAQLPVHVVITGGTIDSKWDGTTDTIVTLQDSVVPEYVASLKLDRKIRYSHVCMKDSRSLTATDLRNVLNTIELSEENHVLVTHGTYTMPDTARFIKGQLKRDDLVVVLTGSMVPLSGFTLSDAGFNLGFALASFSQLEPGVYVAMNGQIIDAFEAMKVISEGVFQSMNSMP